jgi:hypothetical protein
MTTSPPVDMRKVIFQNILYVNYILRKCQKLDVVCDSKCLDSTNDTSRHKYTYLMCRSVCKNVSEIHATFK